jgi:hypothetical protein
MQRLTIRRTSVALGSCLVGVALSIAACSDSPSPVAPTPAPSQAAVQQTITITADGISPSLAFVTPGSPVMIVNGDTRSHQLHLDVEDQPGCGGFDLAGEIPPGESRLTGVITGEAVGCDGHDHMSHGDKRFTVQLAVDITG